jgi:DNA-binding beta-propeller fold protein YncE
MLNRVNKLMALALLAGVVSVAGAQSISTTIPFTAPTHGISVDPVRNTIYVVAPQPGGKTVNLAVIDGSTNTVTTTIPLTVGASYPAVDYLANRIYVTGCNTHVHPTPCIVTVIDGNTDTIVATIPVTTTAGRGLTGITVNPLNGLVYVANASDDVINVINGRKAELRSSISLNGNHPRAIALNPIFNLLYVPYGNNQTAVVDAWTKQILTTTTFGDSTVGAAVDVLTGQVFVTDQEAGQSQTGVLGANGKLVTSITVGDEPLGVDVDPFTSLVFVAAAGADQVDVINSSNNTLQATVTGVTASYVAVNPVTQMVYVSGTVGVTVLSEN